MRHVDYFPSCFFLQIKIVKNIKMYFQGFFYSNVQGLGCVLPPPKFLPFRKTSFRDITFGWDFESIVSDFLIFWTFIGHWFSTISDRIYSSSMKRFIGYKTYGLVLGAYSCDFWSNIIFNFWTFQLVELVYSFDG